MKNTLVSDHLFFFGVCCCYFIKFTLFSSLYLTKLSFLSSLVWVQILFLFPQTSFTEDSTLDLTLSFLARFFSIIGPVSGPRLSRTLQVTSSYSSYTVLVSHNNYLSSLSLSTVTTPLVPNSSTCLTQRISCRFLSTITF